MRTIKFVIVLNFVKFHTLKIIFVEITQGRRLTANPTMPTESHKYRKSCDF